MATMAVSLLRKFIRRPSITALASAQSCLTGQQAEDKVQIYQVSNLLTAGNKVSHFVRTVTNTTSSITSEGLAASVRGGSGTTAEAGCGSGAGPTAEPVDDRVRVLEAALDHVPRLGWSTEALVEGSRDAGFSPAFVGAFSRGESELVEYFMDDCKAKLVERVMDRRAELDLMPQQQRIAEVVRERLELQARFCASWPQALSIQARPHNLTHTLRQRMELGEALWQAVGGRGSGVEVYIQKGLLGVAYQEAELFMLTDFSPGFRDTWAFLERRLEGAERMKRSAHEASEMAQSVGTKVATALASIMQGR